jgi:hypothetical protein
MMSVADSDNLQNLLTNLNIDISPGYNNDKKVEKLVLQLGELSSRYSDLASRYLKLVNSKVHEPLTTSILSVPDNNSTSNNVIQKPLLELLAVKITNTSIVFKFFRNFPLMYPNALHRANSILQMANLPVI